MRVFVIGKSASVTHWLEDCVEAWRAGGHEVGVGVTRDPRLHASIDAMLLASSLGAPRAAAIARSARRFSPDIIIAIGAFEIPLPVLERLAAEPVRAPIVGWVGDLFSMEARPAADLLDAVAYTDSGLVELHGRLGFAAAARFVPHATSPRPGRSARQMEDRERRMVFIANPTDHRRHVVSQISSPISLYGPGWIPVPGVDHLIVGRRVAARALQSLYGAHLGALNIRNEHHVLRGLNQRNFDPYISGTPVVSDNQADLERCFEPGLEVLIYRNPTELNEIHARLRREPGEAERVGGMGRARVLAEHTYAHRLRALSTLC